MKKLSFLVVAALLGIGCAHLSNKTTQIQEAKNMLAKMVPEVIAYYTENHSCPPFDAEAWETDPWVKETEHWNYFVVPGKKGNTCYIAANYKIIKTKVGATSPVLTLKIKEGVPSSAIQLDMQKITAFTEEDNTSSVSAESYTPDEKTCHTWGGLIDNNSKCVLF